MQATKTPAFTDTSIFQGVREYRDNSGTQYVAERDPFGGKNWKMFRLQNGIKVFICTVFAPRGATPIQLHHALNRA